MLIKIRDAKRGLHPRESIVLIDTIMGPEELVVDESTARLAAIDVGHPIAINDRNYLVELPAETSKGAWRVWIGEESILNRAEAAE
jgi:hypothetical protein